MKLFLLMIIVILSLLSCDNTIEESNDTNIKNNKTSIINNTHDIDTDNNNGNNGDGNVTGDGDGDVTGDGDGDVTGDGDGDVTGDGDGDVTGDGDGDVAGDGDGDVAGDGDGDVTGDGDGDVAGDGDSDVAGDGDGDGDINNKPEVAINTINNFILSGTTISSTASDLDNDLLTYQWSEVTDHGVTFTDNTSLTTNVAYSSFKDGIAVIEVTVRFTASDGEDSTSVEATFKIYRTDYLYFSKNGTGNGLSPLTPRGASGGDINSAIDEAFNSNMKAVAISEGTYEVTYASSGGTHVQMKDGVSLYGGYSSSTFLRDRTQYTTTIKNISHNADSTASYPSRAIEIMITNTESVTIDGLTVVAGTDDTLNRSSVAILTGNDATGTISNNIITTQDNNINQMKGIKIKNSSFIIKNNIIKMKSCVNNGEDYTIFNGGILISGTGNNTIIGNRISAGTAISTVATRYAFTFGIRLEAYTGDTLIFNNIIVAGESEAIDEAYESTKSITIFNASGDIKIYNNTIINNISSKSSVGLEVTDSNPEIINNLIYITGTSASPYCVVEKGHPYPLFRNNNLYNTNSVNYYYDIQNDTSLNYITALNEDIENGVSDIGSLLDWGNGGIDPSSSFVSIGGTDGVINTIDDNNWQLTDTSHRWLRQGGQNLTSKLSGYDLVDIEGNPRTSTVTETGMNANAGGWSMGAYEKD